MRIFIAIALFIVCFGSILFIFWKQEVKFSLPTPVPSNLEIVEQGDSVKLPQLLNFIGKPLYIHFYNYDCPCSRFNMKEFELMVAKFSDKVNFLAIVESSGETTSNAGKEFKEKYELNIPTISDTDGALAKELGIYSTPQAVLIKDNKIFYKGNYNKARFCTSKNTKFAEMALQALIKNESPPDFPLLATIPYGCELPSHSRQESGLSNLFNF
ncbi:AhpC/TSA family protein [Marivirga lumbricoides]|uniref:AhpC/TSA family protein n=1 Tax=Marivirga lumbricoides TaxID=1046115 RepID=A0A2T4DUS8_9BACT|nr:AhpC/TSA family protein [Marivirga lumbricoides]